MSFLMDIYKGEKSCRELTTKHRVSSTAQQAVKLALFVDEDGYSVMGQPPTMQDVKTLMKTRHQIERKRIAARKKNKEQIDLLAANKRNQLKLDFQPVESKRSAKIKPKTKTCEISILWGLIKIKH